MSTVTEMFAPLAARGNLDWGGEKSLFHCP